MSGDLICIFRIDGLKFLDGDFLERLELRASWARLPVAAVAAVVGKELL